MNWMQRAACKGHTTEWWFYDKSPRMIERVRAICMGCEVRVDCQSYAMTHRIDYGVWGGLTADERKRARRSRKKVAR